MAKRANKGRRGEGEEFIIKFLTVN